MFLRRHRKRDGIYYSLVENQKLGSKVVQSQLHWLGTFDDASRWIASTQHLDDFERNRWQQALLDLRNKPWPARQNRGDDGPEAA